jgi:putative ABC transport system permease protein
MNLMQSFRMALATIKINKIRSFLTMLGIIIGVTAVIALVSVMQGYNADITQYYQKMGVNKITVSTTIYQFYDSLALTDELVSYVQSDLAKISTGVTPTASTTGTLAYGSTAIKSTSTIAFGNEQYSTCNNFVVDSGRGPHILWTCRIKFKSASSAAMWSQSCSGMRTQLEDNHV